MLFTVHCSLVQFIVILDPFKAHLGDLLRDQPHQKDQGCVDEQNRGHIGETMVRDVGEEVIGKPYQEIVKVAKERAVELVILGTHGYTGLKHFQLGSTAERVVRYAPCPVLVVREQEREFTGLDQSVKQPLRYPNETAT